MYDEDGNLTTGTMADYLVPSAADLVDVRHRPHRDTGDAAIRSASRASARPARSRRRRRSSTRSLTRCVRYGVTEIRMPAITRARLAGDWTDGLGTDLPTNLHSGGAPMIPASLDYVAPDSIVGVVSALVGGGRGRQAASGRSEPACQSSACASPTRRRSSTSARSTQLRGVREDNGSLVIGAMTTALRRDHRPADRQHAPLIAAGNSHGRRPGDPASRHVRRVAVARRPGRRPSGCRAGARCRLRARGPGWTPHRGRVGVLRRLPPDRALAGRAARRDPGAEARAAGACTTRSSNGSPRPGPSSASQRPSASRTARSPRRGSG